MGAQDRRRLGRIGDEEFLWGGDKNALRLGWDSGCKIR